MSPSKDIFDEFNSVSAKQWKQKIQFDLKGSDYNKTLQTPTNEGIIINPFYHEDDYKQLDIPDTPEIFKICQTFYAGNERIANKLAKDSLKRGAESVKFIVDKPFDIKILMDKAAVDIPVFFSFNFLDADFLDKLRKELDDRKVYFNIDIIGNLVKTGNWFFNNRKDHQLLTSVLKKVDDKNGVLGVDISAYQNAGANIVQQVAYALAHASEYLNDLVNLEKEGKITKTQKNFTVKNMVFTFSTGYNYFFEVAKLRAFRYLWKLLLKEYQMDYKANIFAVPSLRNKTIFDMNVNMLRTTSESMSAIFGGADFIENIAYDAVINKNNEFGERISRNQLIILKEESGLKNARFAKGAYYIEEITFDTAVKALHIFKEIEKGGGFVKQLFQGTVQRKIRENAKKEQEQFDTGKLILLGSNKYPNTEEKIQKGDLELFPFKKKRSKETQIEPVVSVRLAEVMEKERIKD